MNVKFIDKETHEKYPQFYPEVGTVGKVVGEIGPDGDFRVQWPGGSTSGNDLWYCNESRVVIVEGE